MYHVHAADMAWRRLTDDGFKVSEKLVISADSIFLTLIIINTLNMGVICLKKITICHKEFFIFPSLAQSAIGNVELQ